MTMGTGEGRSKDSLEPLGIGRTEISNRSLEVRIVGIQVATGPKYFAIDRARDGSPHSRSHSKWHGSSSSLRAVRGRHRFSSPS